MRVRVLLSAVAAIVLSCATAVAQTFPAGPVKIVVSVGPGSSPDVCGRLLAEYLTRRWGQQVVVFNQPGGAGGVAIRAVGAAPPDGHTLYIALATNFIQLPELTANFPIDTVRDLVPIGFVGGHPMVIAASPDLGVATLPELVALARKRKGELNVAAGNRGSMLHLTGEWLRQATGIDMTLLHYPAASQALTDVMGGRVHVMIDAVAAMRGAIEGGRLKPLAVASKQRLSNFPDLPTFAETIPNFEAVGWLALMAPPGTPEPVARKISEDVHAIVSTQEFAQRYLDHGTYTQPMSPAELSAFIREQKQVWGPVIAQTAKAMR